MRLYQLEYFIKVVECGSITKAASELYLSQPALTKAISSLETEYHIKLFNRTARGIRLTAKGREFLEYAQSVVDSCHAMENTFGKKRDPAIPRVTIASQQFDFIYDLLLSFYQKHEDDGIQIDFQENDRGEIAGMVANRRADMGILVLTEQDIREFRNEVQQMGLEVHFLDQASAYICMGPHSPLYGREYVDTEEIRQSPHVALDLERTMRRELRYREIYQGINKERLVFCNTAGACRKFLEETDMIMFVSKWTVGLFENGSLRCVPVKMNGKDYPDANQLVWVKRVDEEFHPLEEEFKELLKQRFVPA